MVETKVTVPVEEIKRLKGMGFLHCKGTDRFNARVITRNGKVTHKEMTCIAEAAKLYGTGEVSLTARLTFEVQGIEYIKIEDFQKFIAREGLFTGGTGNKVRPIVSCKGTTCQYGLIDTYALSEKIHERFFMGYRDVVLPHKYKIAVGGCPNNCTKPSLNDVGIVGQRITKVNEEKCKLCKKCAVETNCPMKSATKVDGKVDLGINCSSCGRCIKHCVFNAVDEVYTGYKVFIGGRWGKKISHGKVLNKVFTSEEEVLNVVEKTIIVFKEKGIAGERFADTIERIGFEEIEKMLLKD